MWILPNNELISVPQSVVINDIQHPQTIFYGWSKEQLLNIGIRIYHPANAQEGYRVTAARTEVVDDEVYEIFDFEKVQEIVEEATQEPTEEPSTTTP